jgi:hypothetical protein
MGAVASLNFLNKIILIPLSLSSTLSPKNFSFYEKYTPSSLPTDLRGGH